MQKDVVKYITENSTDENVLDNLTNYAVSVHGKDKVINTLEKADDDTFEDAVYHLATTPKQNLEDNPYIQGLYQGVKNLSLGPAKVAAHVATPVLEAARMPLKYIAENVGSNTSQTPPINAYAEFTEPGTGYGLGYPSSRATTANILTDLSNAMGIKQEPLAKVNIPEFPQASEFLTQMTNPVNPASVGLDIALGGKGIMGVADKLNKNLVMRPLMSLETAADYVRSLAKNKAQLLELEKSGKIYDIANMVRNDPDRFLRPFRPNKVYEDLVGKIDPTNATRNLESGLIHQANELQNQRILSLPDDAYPIEKSQLNMDALSEIGKQKLLKSQKASASRIINEEIPNMTPNPEKIDRIKKIGELSAQYKDIRDNVADMIEDIVETPPNQRNKYVSSSEFSGGEKPAPRMKQNQEKITKLAEIEQQMKDLGAEDPHGSSIESYYDMLRQRDTMTPSEISDLRKRGNILMTPPSLGENPLDVAYRNAAGRAIEKAAHNAQDFVMAYDPNTSWKDIAKYNNTNKEISNMMTLRDLFEGNLVADNYGGLEYAPSSATGKTGGISMITKASGRFIKPVLGPMANSTYNTGVGMINNNQSYANVSRATGMNMIKNPTIEEYKLPRSYDEMKNEIPLVTQKLTQVMGPEAAQMAVNQMMSSPQEFFDKLPLIENQMPGLFRYDRYRRVNGRIFDPTLRTLAEKEILDSPMSNTEKMIKQSMLLKNGTYDGI